MEGILLFVIYHTWGKCFFFCLCLNCTKKSAFWHIYFVSLLGWPVHLIKVDKALTWIDDNNVSSNSVSPHFNCRLMQFVWGVGWGNGGNCNFHFFPHLIGTLLHWVICIFICSAQKNWIETNDGDAHLWIDLPPFEIRKMGGLAKVIT